MEKDLMKTVESFHIVPLGPDGYPAPDLASPPVKGQAGDIYLTQSSERIISVKKYFLNRKYSVPSTEMQRIGETDDQPNS